MTDLNLSSRPRSVCCAPPATAEDISTVASTASDLIVCTHACWAAFGPPEDSLGAPFRPDQDTPDKKKGPRE